jgi:hypothetical protein
VSDSLGRSEDQIARLYGATTLDARCDLKRVLTVLGVPTLRAAIAEATRHRGLIV